MKHYPLWFKALLILLPTLLGLEMLGWMSILPGMARGSSDFRQLYVAGTMVRRGDAAELYDYSAQSRLQSELVSSKELAIPFLRPAYQALFFAPLTLLPFREAYLLWAAVNAMLAAATCILLRSQFPQLEEAGKLLPALVFWAFFPLWVAILQGQDTILLLLLIAGAFLALKSDREFLAGTLLACGLFKFQIVLPVAFLFLLWRRWRFAQGFFAVALLLGGLSLALIGRSGITSFVAALLHIHFPVRYDLMCNLHALLIGLFGNSFAVTLATIALSAVAWLAVAIWSPAKAGPDALMIALATAALVSFYMFAHDASVLILPMLFIMDQGMKRWFGGWVCLAMFLLPLFFVFVPRQVFLTAIPVLLLVFATAQAAACSLEESSTSAIDATLEAVSESAGGSS